MQSVCSTQTPSYRKGKILTDSKNSVPAEGPMRLDHGQLPSTRQCDRTHTGLAYRPEAKLPLSACEESLHLETAGVQALD